MTKLSIAIIAAGAALSLAACDRSRDQAAQDASTQVAQAPSDRTPERAQPPDKDQRYRDPSIPENPPENRASAASPEQDK
jgi:hypothetical protein